MGSDRAGLCFFYGNVFIVFLLALAFFIGIVDPKLAYTITGVAITLGLLGLAHFGFFMAATYMIDYNVSNRFYKIVWVSFIVFLVASCLWAPHWSYDLINSFIGDCRGRINMNPSHYAALIVNGLAFVYMRPLLKP